MCMIDFRSLVHIIQICDLSFTDEATIGSTKDLTVFSLGCYHKSSLFEFTRQASDDEENVICFNFKKHKRLSKIHQVESGCQIKGPELNDEITVTNNTTLKEIEPNFERQETNEYLCL